ncbi:MAG: hypothetical protein BGO53_13695 [Sphingobacteriales bacterium 39-19]|nr:hypothetical protein [Sphingobacteriales bacterium]OJW08725.1 MAG: hypothetical protein BGO53_13695 [Sphingobacteriales bacterium 39-19]
MNKLLSLFMATSMLLSVLSCKKSTEELNTVPLTDYAPMTVGKYITYQLDSLVFTNFGTVAEMHSYQVKITVDALTTDALGRPAYRLFRYIKYNGTPNWIPDNTFWAIHTGNTYEFIENNLRFLKLMQPVRENFSWKGNVYIDTRSANTDFRFMDDWDYVYENVNQPATVGTFTFDSTLTVNQREDSLGLPIVPETQYAEKTLAKEIYAKNIGMVYRNFLHWEFQRVYNGYVGYGVTYTMIDHN